MKKKKWLVVVLIAVLVLLMTLLGIFLSCTGAGSVLIEMIFVRPSKPEIKYAEFPFELVYEYNGEQFTVNETIVCDYEGISFSLEGGNSRDWTCYITNNDDYGRYYLNEEAYIQVPLEADYYMGDPEFDADFATPYIYFADESTGTMYYEQDLTDVIGAKIISWNPTSPLENNIK